MIEELVPLVALFGGGGFVVGYLVIRLLTYLLDWRPLAWILTIGGVAGAIAAGLFAAALITEPSPATILLPYTLALAGVGVGAAVGGWRTIAAGGRKLKQARRAAG